MMILLLATLSAPTPHEITRTPSPEYAKPCAPKSPEWVRQDAPIAPRKLTEEPNAEAYLGVLHIDENGCDKPIKVFERRVR